MEHIEPVQRAEWRSKRQVFKEGNQCVRIKASGERCQKPPINGATVCRFHGGAAGHIKRAAKARIENASLLLAKELLGMALDSEMPPAVKLAALKDALDRAGLGARAALDVVHELKPYQAILDGIDRDFMAGPTVVDGEVVPPEWGEFDDGRTA